MRILAAAFAAVIIAGTSTTAQAQDAQFRLWDASIEGDTAQMRMAIRDGADIQALDTRRARNGRRALNWAALGNHAAAIRMLLAAGAGRDSTNLTGFTALHHAAEAGAMEAAQALLEAGADPRRTNAAGMTPSAMARARGHHALADSLEAAEQRRRP